MRAWNIFFGITALLIVTTMMIPSVFGLQSFTQWGGMYVDGWCTAYVRTESGTTEFLKCPQMRVTWFSPMHSRSTCAAWTRSLCDTSRSSGRQVTEAYPYYRGEYFMQSTNVCDLLPSDPPWFLQP